MGIMILDLKTPVVVMLIKRGCVFLILSDNLTVQNDFCNKGFIFVFLCYTHLTLDAILEIKITILASVFASQDFYDICFKTFDHTPSAMF